MKIHFQMAVLEQDKSPLLRALVSNYSTNLNEVQQTSLDVAGEKRLIAGVQAARFHG